METITKRITTKEVTEYIARCGKCDKRIVGSTEGQVAFNLTVHKQGKECKSKDAVYTTDETGGKK